MWTCSLLLLIAFGMLVVFGLIALDELAHKHTGKYLWKHHPPYGDPGWYDQEPPPAAKADVAWYDDY